MDTFIVSSERSGSNLLQVLIGKHPQLAPLPPIHFGKYFGDVSGLVDDSCAFPQNYWFETFGSVANVFDDSWPISAWAPEPPSGNDFWSSLLRFYKLSATEMGKPFFVAKENNVFTFINDIIIRAPEIRFVYLVRDGRSVALSATKLSRGTTSLQQSTRQWICEQLACLRVQRALGPEKKMLVVYYENLVTQPEREMRRIYRHLELDDSTDQQNTLAVTSKRPGHREAWRNLNGSVRTDRVNPWRNELSSRQLATMYRQEYQDVSFGQMLRILGYDVPSDHLVPIHTGALRSKLATNVDSVATTVRKIRHARWLHKEISQPWLKESRRLRREISKLRVNSSLKKSLTTDGGATE